MNKLTGLDWLALVLLIVGGLNWGFIGLWDMNVVMNILGSGTLTNIVYDLVGLAAIYAIWASMKWGRKM
ncbi:MAG: hypothetical protein A3G02_02335 [Candidatus Yanofskybacteria bacterium RIFCSPLOWO2_12_FULL_44_13b]|uniref:DUF378 domain-containing protein n=2 Tax=Candidatus Yanofskyibacteriota TaxID=1752733 RepID=A0A1F8H1N9_9BACT|nr:MAG: hypothetical protein UW14_C0014G0006 [Candidatus Yanofskybacteria bacterium GW2011_GWA2_44_10]KKT89960.1 MAG: hypothetical protein UW90_C0010G0007 [Candidatus Yanofskybacteria bacterium GW2011_GWB1_45_11]OGN02072.1 MAG: hypothetical protein A2657_01890 [Candidatus Yanofskybacteria bacterium RIFCSPHIGHO2_01_FULL_44_110b]OGN18526.1 MAG: hypothetical protein A3F50_02115 [Candidatus Yanofskybacteria bacterium RIFCSPHIGHO2_12_FULL_44_29b]OGN26471.1 MAG: hypothetical protein A3B12_03000 [Cand